MAIEAGLLATPSVRFNFLVEDGDLGGYDVLGDTYGLVRSTTDVEEGLELVARLAADPDAGRRWAERRARLVEDSIDVTEFMLDRIHALAGQSRGRVTADELAEPRPLAGDGGSA
jgi:predicted glycosyltransferase